MSKIDAWSYDLIDFIEREVETSREEILKSEEFKDDPKKINTRVNTRGRFFCVVNTGGRFFCANSLSYSTINIK